eukprot:COSAG06_NODE_1320_length_9872_cov_49.877213_18_plen_91_part_00
MWIWVMAPNVSDPNDPNADYMFNYRPAYQFIPDQRRLESWYTKLLQSAREAGILQVRTTHAGRCGSVFSFQIAIICQDRLGTAARNSTVN